MELHHVRLPKPQTQPNYTTPVQRNIWTSNVIFSFFFSYRRSQVLSVSGGWKKAKQHEGGAWWRPRPQQRTRRLRTTSTSRPAAGHFPPRVAQIPGAPPARSAGHCSTATFDLKIFSKLRRLLWILIMNCMVFIYFLVQHAPSVWSDHCPPVL